jgi:hypothetical protein
MSPPVLELVRERILLLDYHPWYAAEPGLEPFVRETLSDIYPRILGAPEIARALDWLLPRAVPPGSIVLAPLMAGAVLLDPLRHYAASHDCVVMPLAISRHPYVTLVFDTDDLQQQTLTAYAEAATRIWTDVVRLIDASGCRQVVYLDVNSATGRDALLIERLLHQRLGERVCYAFAVLIDETGDDPGRAAGWREGPKTRIADQAAIRLIGHNTKYFSHLAYLQLDDAGQQARRARAFQACPHLLRFWDDVPEELRAIHGYQRPSNGTRPLHLRYSQSEQADAIGACVAARWDDARVRRLVRADETPAAWRIRQLSTERSLG